VGKSRQDRGFPVGRKSETLDGPGVPDEFSNGEHDCERNRILDADFSHESSRKHDAALHLDHDGAHRSVIDTCG